MSAKLSVLALTRRLLRFNTVNPPGQERACAKHLGKLLEGAGFTTSYSEFADHRATLVARIGGQDVKAPLAMTGHIDTVPLGGIPWQRDPFAGETDGDRIFGRGASDMKSGVAAMVIAALQLASKLRNSPGLVLIFTAGEETGNQGAHHLASIPNALTKVGALVIGEPTENYPLLGSKGSLKLQLTARGVTAHGALPEAGVNAVFKAAHAVCRLENYRFDIEPHPVMGFPSLNVGYMHGGINLNSVPDKANIGIDIRTIAGQQHDAIETDIRRHVGDEVEVTKLRENEVCWTEPDQAWVHQVFDIMTPLLGTSPKPGITFYGTDGPALGRPLGRPPMVILGPGEMSAMHVTDEWCSAKLIEIAVDAYTRIMRAWCAI